MLHNLSLGLKNFKLPPHRWQNHIGPDADIRTNRPGGGTLNVEVMGIFSEIFLENPKNTQILILNP